MRSMTSLADDREPIGRQLEGCQVQLRDQHTVGMEPWVDAQDVAQRPGEEKRRKQQRDREGNLDDDERAPNGERLAPGGHAASPVHDRSGGDAGSTDRRRQAKQDARRQCQPTGKPEHRPVDAERQSDSTV